MEPKPAFMVFDVESVGLQGEGFAVGWVVVDAFGQQLGEGYAACLSSLAEGRDSDREWIGGNVLPHLPPATHESRHQLLWDFWSEWHSWHGRGARLAADVAWPVEARFLLDCARQDLYRHTPPPYPLIDVSSVLLAAGLDPVGSFPRLPDEMPAHHPTSDARQSARLLVQALQRLLVLPRKDEV